MNDNLPNRIQTGTVSIRPNVQHFYKDGVQFEDKSEADIDVVIKATGYTFGFPFLDKKYINVEKNRVDLYERVWPVNCCENGKGTLAIIGCVTQLGGLNSFSEIQCRWATRVFKVRVYLIFTFDKRLLTK